MNGIRRYFTPLAPGAGRSLLIAQLNELPVLEDSWPDGADFYCAHCRQTLLARCVDERQLWDMAFICRRCGGVSSGPVHSEGAMPPARVVAIDGGLKRLSGPVQLMSAALISSEELARRRAMIGPGTFEDPAPNRSKGALAPALLKEMLGDLHKLLGADYDKCRSEAANGRASTTKPQRRNDLGEAIIDLEAAIDDWETPSPTIQGDSLGEVRILISLLARWQRHPSYARISRGVASEFRHTVTMLVAASAFHDMGNAVELVPEGRSRTPDVQLMLEARSTAVVEVKTPSALWRPAAELTAEQAEGLVAKAIKKAKTSAGGQLASGAAGLLVLGASGIQINTFEMMRDASTKYLARAASAGRHKSMLGVALVRLTWDVATDASGDATAYDAFAQFEFVNHPGYTGSVSASIGPRFS